MEKIGGRQRFETIDLARAQGMAFVNDTISSTPVGR